MAPPQKPRSPVRNYQGAVRRDIAVVSGPSKKESKKTKEPEKKRLEAVHMRDLHQKMVNVVQKRLDESGRSIREKERFCCTMEEAVKELPFEMLTLLDTDVVLDEDDAALRKDPKLFRAKAEAFALSDDSDKVIEALCYSKKRSKFFDKWYNPN